MKHALSILSFCLLMVGTALAQPAARLSAFNQMREGNYESAINYIEPATKHEKTANSAKTWYYRGMIYQQLYQSRSAADEELKKKHPKCLETGVESYLKAKGMDTKRIPVNELDKNLRIGGQQLVNEGIAYYNDKDYPSAMVAFELASKAADVLGFTDTLAMYNAALAAEKSSEPEKAMNYYQRCIDVNYGGAKVYYFLANLHLDQGNTAKFTEVIDAGRVKYPDDQSLITAQINIYLKADDSAKALEALNAAIANDPSNASLYFARGTINEKEGKVDAAITDYNKAVEIKPDYFDAWYNMGALYFNNGVDKINAANELPTSEQKKYDQLRNEAMEDFKTALPYLEKAEKINPEDENTLVSLKELYLRTNNTDGFNRVNAKLSN